MLQACPLWKGNNCSAVWLPCPHWNCLFDRHKRIFYILLKCFLRFFHIGIFWGGASLFCCRILFKKTRCQHGLFCACGWGILLFFHTQNLNLPVNPSLSVSLCTTVAADRAPLRESVHRNLLKAITGLSNGLKVCFSQYLI